MTEQEIYTNLETQQRLDFNINVALEENGGEITDEIQEMMDAIDSLNETLFNEGAADDVARHMVRIQDFAEQVKAERDVLDRKVKRMAESVERRKLLLRRLLDRSGDAELKGTYTIKAYDSRTTKANNKLINELFRPRVEDALRSFTAEHPDISVELKGSATAAKELAELPEWYVTEEKDTIKIIKPRQSKTR